MKRVYLVGRLMALGALLSMTSGCDLINRLLGSKQSASNMQTAAAGLKAETEPLSPADIMEQNSNGPVIVKIEGKPVGYKDEFLQFAQDFIKATPLAQFGLNDYASAPAPIKEQLFNAYVEQKLVTRWGHDEGVEHEAEYKETLNRLLARIKQELMAKTFEKRIFDSITVSDEEVRSTFEKHKERFIKEQGGLQVIGAGFDADEKATVFQHLLNEGSNRSFEELAKESSGEFKDFGRISTDPRMAFTSPLPPALRATVFSLDKNDTYGRAVDGDTHWVLKVTDRSEPTYSSFDEVREQVTMGARTEKFMQEREVQLKALREKYTVDIDNGPLESENHTASMTNPFATMMGGADPQAAEEEVEASAVEEALAIDADQGDDDGEEMNPAQLQEQLQQLLGQLGQAEGDDVEGEGDVEDGGEELDLEALLKNLGIDAEGKEDDA
ncbi:MAG: peptidylprolyl isomerase [Candidatus Dependentiae bacterium]|jgi:hypothetical protein